MNPPEICPICKKEFTGNDCPHSLREVEDFMSLKNLDERIRRIVREEIASHVKHRHTITGQL